MEHEIEWLHTIRSGKRRRSFKYDVYLKIDKVDVKLECTLVVLSTTHPGQTIFTWRITCSPAIKKHPDYKAIQRHIKDRLDVWTSGCIYIGDSKRAPEH